MKRSRKSPPKSLRKQNPYRGKRSLFNHTKKLDKCSRGDTTNSQSNWRKNPYYRFQCEGEINDFITEGFNKLLLNKSYTEHGSQSLLKKLTILKLQLNQQLSSPYRQVKDDHSWHQQTGMRPMQYQLQVFKRTKHWPYEEGSLRLDSQHPETGKFFPATRRVVLLDFLNTTAEWKCQEFQQQQE